MAWDFKTKPELTDAQMQIYYFESPHKQIFEDFKAKVEKVHDGDTVTLSCNFRDFNFPLRFALINAPELSEVGGKESRDWLKSLIEKREVEILIDRKNRVDKYGRLLGQIMFNGLNVNWESMMTFHSMPFEESKEGIIKSDMIGNFDKSLKPHEVIQWF